MKQAKQAAKMKYTDFYTMTVPNATKDGSKERAFIISSNSRDKNKSMLQQSFLSSVRPSGDSHIQRQKCNGNRTASLLSHSKRALKRDSLNDDMKGEMQVSINDRDVPILYKQSVDQSYDATNLPISPNFQNEAMFLVQNQHIFSKEDFEALLLALAEDGKERKKMQQHEEDSLALAQLLASDYEYPSRKSTYEEDLEALEVALRAEIEEEQSLIKEEEKSFELACRLAGDELPCHMDDRSDSEKDLHPREKGTNRKMLGSSKTCKEECHNIQCSVCHFEIEKEYMIRTLPCGHSFHAFCINRWLQVKLECALCRTTC